ncbi:MAG: dihydrodipicolinate synthase family protein [Planctomycetes bacterium]|nr:dihydrodipicolinate synthase family protein [Planctomycetota bacterium]
MTPSRTDQSDKLPGGSYPAMLTAFQDDGAIDWDGVDRLTDHCIEAGAAGIFAGGLSAEIREMDDEEKGALAERVVRRAAGRVPVVAGAIVWGPLDRQAELIRRVHGAGADAVSVAVSQLAGQDEDDQAWIENAGMLLDRIPEDVRLAMYECPAPYHRLLSDETIVWAAQSERFCFLKDTSCNIETIRRRLDLIRGTRLQLLNANTRTLLASLRAGAEGFCGIGANYMPELFAWLCRHFEDQPDVATKLHEFMDSWLDLQESEFYPASAKEYLRQRGLDIGQFSRKPRSELPSSFAERLAGMRVAEGQWLDRLIG